MKARDLLTWNSRKLDSSRIFLLCFETTVVRVSVDDDGFVNAFEGFVRKQMAFRILSALCYRTIEFSYCNYLVVRHWRNDAV